MSIGKRIKAARKARGWTQMEMAERAGITSPSVNRYEKHNCVPTLAVAIKLAAVLGVSLDELAQDEIEEMRCETACETSCVVSRGTK